MRAKIEATDVDRLSPSDRDTVLRLRRLLDQDAEIACRMAKVAADEVMVFAGDRSVQFHGGFGFTWECDSTLFIRRAQWAQQMYGGAIHHRKRLASLLLDS